MSKISGIAWIFASLLATATACGADSEAVSTYPAAFFAGAHPATASDMIGRVPGFTLDNGNSNRGFAGTGGNVLINGGRPAAKTDSLSTILSRIPSDNVERIEVIRGGAPGIDMQGQSVVANVILKADAATQLIVTTGVTWLGSGQWHPAGAVEYHGQSGDIRYEASAARTVNVWNDSPGNGYRVVTAPGSTPERDHASTYGIMQLGYSLHGGVTAPFWGGEWNNTLTLQSSGLGYGTEYDGLGTSSLYDNDNHQRSAEFGSHWQGLLGAAQLEAVLLQRLNQTESDQNSATPSEDDFFHSLTSSGESIARLTARESLSPALGLEGGGEITWNFFDARSTYVSNGVATILPNANVTAGEIRGESFGIATWKINPVLTLEAGARAEFSRITETGDDHSTRDFFYPKPRLLLSWQADTATQLRLRAERTVGQLNFNDFVASSNLSTYGVAAGNTNMRPDQRWQFEADLERHFWDKGALVFGILHEEITDLRDYVPVGGGLDAPGNIPYATSEKFSISGTVPLDFLGLKNGLFTPNVYWQTSDLIDPVTGEHRRISGQRNIYSYYRISQDLEEWKSTWSVFLGTSFSSTSWRIAQIQRTAIHDSPFINGYWTYKPTPAWAFNFGAENVLPYRLEQEQFNFSGPRGTAGPPTIQDVFIRTTPRIYFNVRIAL